MTPLFYACCILIFFILGFLLTRPLSAQSNFWKLLGWSLPVSLSAMLLLVGLAGRLVGNFPHAIVWGTLFALLVSVAVWFSTKPPALSFGNPFQRADWPLALFTLLTSAGIAVLAWRYAFHDERAVQGHPALVESMLRGVYPPYFLAFPEIPNKYHYGFDFFAAILAKAFPLPGYHAVDLAAILLWPALMVYGALLLRALGVPRRYLGLGLAYVVFSGGMSWLIAAHEPGRWQIPQWQFLWIGERLISHHFVFYFFQHPISLGVLLFLGCLRLFQLWFESGRRYPLLLAAFCLGVLSLAHVMFFVTLLASVGFIVFVRFFLKDTAKLANLISGLGILAVAVMVALALGGFFQFSRINYDNASFRFAWPPGYLGSVYPDIRAPIAWSKALIWYFGSFGLYLLILPVALWLAVRQRSQILWLLAFYAILSFVIPQWISYTRNGNVEKWFISFELAGKMLAAAVFLPYLNGRKIWTVVAIGFVLFSVVTPFEYVYGLALKNPKTWSSEQRRLANALGDPSGAFQKLVDRLKGCTNCLGMVWATGGTGKSIAIYTGYPVIPMDNTVYMPVSPEKISQRNAAIRELFSKPSTSLLDRLRIRWVIFSCKEFKDLKPEVQTFLEELKQSPQFQDRSVPGPENDCYWALERTGT